MRLFSHTSREPHLGQYPSELLGRARGGASLLSDVDSLLLDDCLDSNHLGRSISDFMCALDAVREGDVNPKGSAIPESPTERSQHMKSAGYFLDSSIVGVCALTDELILDTPKEHARLHTTTYHTAAEKLRLRFNPAGVLRQMEKSKEKCKQSVHHHRYALVFLVEYPRDPASDEQGAKWISDLQNWRAAVRTNETAVVMANYLRLLGYDARSHSATTSDVNLGKLAVAAGLATVNSDGEPENPFVGTRFGLAAVTTSMELEPDQMLRAQTFADRMRSKGIGWHLGSSAPKNAGNSMEFEGRDYKDSRFPTEKLKRVEKTTNFIDEKRIPRVPKSSEFFLRAAFGDLGKHAQDVSIDGYSVSKAPLAAALRLALNVYSLIQRGDPEEVEDTDHKDHKENADIMKATMHFLGADISGVSKAPDYVWYSHRQDGTEMPVAHENAVSVMIDQGYETMDGASGDDWISSAQSMRTYMRAALYCGIVALHLRKLGYEATAHSAADSDVIQTPLVLLAGLGEVSRIGETILNPFLGPRLKTGILTTNFPMEADLPIDFGLQKFCGSCNKCARECPSGAISSGPKKMFNGYEIWKADVEKCTRYRTTNMGGAMCGRCMKTCPWNLAGLVKEAPFRWAAVNFPWAAKWIAMADDWLNRGTINPIKKWWWDIANDGTGHFAEAEMVNERGLNKHIDLKYEDQTLACYPVEIVPPPLPKPNPVDREAGIDAYQKMISPEEYKERLSAGDTEGLVGELEKVAEKPEVFIGKVQRRWTSSEDGKIDVFEIVDRSGKPMPAFTAGAHVDITVTPQFVRQFLTGGRSC